MIRSIATMTLAVLLGAAVQGQEGQKQGVSQEAQKAQARLKKHLGKLAMGGQFVSITAPDLAKNFPDYQFVALRFRIYPVARQMPEGMKPSNLFTVPKQGKPEHLKDGRALEAFFHKHAPAVKDKGDSTASELVRSWLSLSQEFVQDGFYKFEVSKDTSMAGKDGQVLSVVGRAVVTQGGRGDIQATMSFKEGKVEKVAEVRKVIEGPRPICQATKLLDPDEIVRRMAERDLLFLGRAAHDYLMEQRATAGPELRQAIDRLWQRIQEQER
ncbi:MAG: hypothetical protein L0Z62_46310 [Gemmataceae bacterium]|nr:hypothetical protein [Gemmataceae bacterium]